MLSVNAKINITLTNKPQHQTFVNMESQYLFLFDVKNQYIINKEAQHQQNINTSATSISRTLRHQQSINDASKS